MLKYSIIKELVLLVAILGITACGQVTPNNFPTISTGREILPYKTPTQVLVTRVPRSVTPVIVTSIPTKTPFSHTIERGDTMLGIAIRYGIELEDLQAVNSGIDPNVLSVGSQLIIPLNDDAQINLATPTPVPVMLRSLDCYPTADQGAWCFVIVENNYPYALEDVSVWVGIFSEQGELVKEEITFSLLNIVGSNEIVPLTVFVAPPVPVSITAETRLLTAMALPGNDSRYLKNTVEISEVIIHPDGLSAEVYGNVNFPPGTRSPKVVWLVAVAYSEGGNVVGVRKWEVHFPQADDEIFSTEALDEISTVTPLSISPLPFEVEIYSLGPSINRIEILSEARP